MAEVQQYLAAIHELASGDRHRCFRLPEGSTNSLEAPVDVHECGILLAKARCLHVAHENHVISAFVGVLHSTINPGQTPLEDRSPGYRRTVLHFVKVCTHERSPAGETVSQEHLSPGKQVDRVEAAGSYKLTAVGQASHADQHKRRVQGNTAEGTHGQPMEATIVQRSDDTDTAGVPGHHVPNELPVDLDH